jgi:uncharacterized protein (TIGR00730 family)
MTSIRSVCVYCGSSDAVGPAYYRLAEALGAELAAQGVRMVYGGGGVGLMGAAARAAHGNGGAVLGVIPRFLMAKERAYDAVEHRIVETMHERKKIMFDESDAFIVAPGGIGTLEEAVETLSWMRLGLHRKPMAFLADDGYWDPFFALLDHTVRAGFTPAEFRDLIIDARSPAQAIDALTASIAVAREARAVTY